MPDLDLDALDILDSYLRSWRNVQFRQAEADAVRALIAEVRSLRELLEDAETREAMEKAERLTVEARLRAAEAEVKRLRLVVDGEIGRWDVRSIAARREVPHG